MTNTITPTVSWAQRSSADDETRNIIYLTIEVADVKDVNIDLKPTTLSFSAKSQDTDTNYELKLEFYDEIDPENSKQNLLSGNRVFLLLRKKIMKEEYWPRLIKDKVKLRNIKTDFDKWVDEDEQDEEPEGDDLAGMQGMGGMPGMEGMGGMPGMGGMGGIPASDLY